MLELTKETIKTLIDIWGEHETLKFISDFYKIQMTDVFITYDYDYIFTI